MRLEERSISTFDNTAELPRQYRSWLQRIDWSVVVLGIVLLAALSVRLYDLNWDINAHLHPDERQITMVSQCLGLRSSPPGCKPSLDPANPHFFAYGTFPMYLLALVAHGLATVFGHWKGLPTDGGTFDDYNHFTLVGRALSAIFDTGTVLLVALIVRKLVGRWWGAFAAAFVAMTPFEIQLSHFYAVDTVLTFFVTLTLFGAIHLAMPRPIPANRALPPFWPTIGWSILTGVAFGLAMASKISAAPLAVPMVIALILRWRILGMRNWADIASGTVAMFSSALLIFMITMPYAFLDYAGFMHDVTEQGNLAKGVIVYPYTIQFTGSIPYIYELKNILIWDMGIPLAVAGFIGVLYALWRIWQTPDSVLLIPLAWVLIYFGITGSFYTKFSRYQLPIFPMLAVFAAIALSALCRAKWPVLLFRRFAPDVAHKIPRIAARTLAGIVLAGGLVMLLAFMSIYTDPMTRLAASDWIYANIPPNSVITHEIWDDGLPLQRGIYSPYMYQYKDMDLYSADTVQKAYTLSDQIASADAIVIASNRLVGSIRKEPQVYPLTIHYYDLLFSGKLGFTLVKMFQNSPHLGPFVLNDAQADESFSVYDHPTVWIFRKNATALTADQIRTKLLADVTISAQTTTLASQKSLLLSGTPNDISNPRPLWQRFDPAGWATKMALPLWWIAVELLGLAIFPLAYAIFPGLRDRGWGLTKALGILVLSYLSWIAASVHLIPYERLTVEAFAGLLMGMGGWLLWRNREQYRQFLQREWRFIVATEILVLAAFLFFVYIRSLDPDLWHIYRGGEKPMELAFLNGILRSRWMPPLDPWFAGGYINYYYFGQFLIATLIQLTGIVPETAFNLAIPLLFALTISGAVSIVGGLTRRWWIGAIGGWFLAVAGNLDGLHQLIIQIQAASQHAPIPLFDYWASSRVIPYTINEFPYWSFLYADLHAHVIDLPIILIELGLAASLIVQRQRMEHWRIALTIAVGALVLGAMAAINTWDAPTYGAILVVAILLAEWRMIREETAHIPGFFDKIRAAITWPWLRTIALMVIGLGVGAIALYLPFYTHFQSFYGKIGPVTTPTDPILFLTIFGVWLFIVTTLYLLDIRAMWEERVARTWPMNRIVPASDATQRLIILLFVAVFVGTLLIIVGVKLLLYVYVIIGLVLAYRQRHDPVRLFTYLLIVMGLALALVVEMIYLRDFLDGSDWERMNTVFKFYYQAWLLFALGSSLALWRIIPALLSNGDRELRYEQSPSPWLLPILLLSDINGAQQRYRDELLQTTGSEPDRAIEMTIRGTWLGMMVFLLLASSIFLVQGTQVRVADRTIWQQVQPPVNPPPATPSLDGFGYMYAWYPGDAAAIAWINRTIGGAPVILEASADPYQWYGRVSIYTGLPAVLGWGSHESQQRYPDEVYARQPDVAAVYSSNDPAIVQSVLARYNVSYIYVGQLECLAYGVHDPHPSSPQSQNVATCNANNDIIGSLAVFGQMTANGVLTIVYQQQGVTIYHVAHLPGNVAVKGNG